MGEFMRLLKESERWQGGGNVVGGYGQKERERGVKRICSREGGINIVCRWVCEVEWEMKRREITQVEEGESY